MNKSRFQKNIKIAGLGFGFVAGYVLMQQLWAIWQLIKSNAERTRVMQATGVPSGQTVSETTEAETYTRLHTIEDGIERIIYYPKQRRFDTPIIMQHGMWHGAWCWKLWQELFAEWGWETHAYSLPGHGSSPTQRPLARCTLDYYLSFLQFEIGRLPRRPVLIGHSMGGALTQWYLKYVSDDLPAAVLVAPWVSHSMIKDGFLKLISFDPAGVFLMLLSWDATPMIRKGKGSAVRFLVGPKAVVALEDLQPKLGKESALVLYQHNPPFWYPPESIKSPMLWIAGEEDALLVEAAERCSAAYYGADYIVAKGARHNVMMEHNYRETAESIHKWLIEQGVP